MVVLKMHCVFSYLLRAGLLFCLIEEIVSKATEGSIQSHCSQRSKGNDLSDQTPIEMNDSEFPDPPPDARFLLLEICPNGTTLKVSWKIKRNSVGDIKLCYVMKATYNGQLLMTKCVKLTVQFTTRRSQMMCWFPMNYLSNRPIISAYASPLAHEQAPDFFGELDTNALADTDSCKHVCETKMIYIRNYILCNDIFYVDFDTRISIRGLHLYPIGSTTCMERSVPISSQKSNTGRLEFTLNCTFTGVVNITIYYWLDGSICNKYFPVRMVCDSVSKSTKVTNDSSTSLLTAIGVVIFNVVIIVTAIVYIVMNRPQANHQRVSQGSDEIQTDRNGQDNIALNSNNSNTNRVRIGDDIHVDAKSESSPCIDEKTTNF